MMAAETKGLALEVGVLTPKMTPRDSLKAGEIGYIVTNLKTTREAKVGDTVTLEYYEASPISTVSSFERGAVTQAPGTTGDASGASGTPST